MHPILKNIRTRLCTGEGGVGETGDHLVFPDGASGAGIATAPHHDHETRAQVLDDKLPPARVEREDVFRSPARRRAEERDLRYHSGKAVRMAGVQKIGPEDFAPDAPGSSRAARLIEAAELRRNAQHTDSLERWAYDAFVNSCRVFLLRGHTGLGMMYLHDFIQTFLAAPPSHALTAQWLTLQHHIESAPLRRAFSLLNEKAADGRPTQQWLVDLVAVLNLILREGGMTLQERLAAISTTCNQLSLHFAKRACQGGYPTADKLSKTNTYFRRTITSILALCEALGRYQTTPVTPRPRKRARQELEDSDASYLFSLERALEEPESDEEDDEDDGYAEGPDGAAYDDDR